MGALYLVCGLLELPARWRYTTRDGVGAGVGLQRVGIAEDGGSPHVDTAAAMVLVDDGDHGLLLSCTPPSGRGGVSHRAVRAPQPHTCVCGPAVVLRPARRAVCLDLPLAGEGFVLRFTGRRMVPSRPVELHPRGQLFLTPVFQDFSGFKIDLHWSRLSCAR